MARLGVIVSVLVVAVAAGTGVYMFSGDEGPVDDVQPSGSNDSSEDTLVFAQQDVPYDVIRGARMIGGEVAYIASAYGKDFVVHGGEDGRQFGRVLDLTALGDDPVVLGGEDPPNGSRLFSLYRDGELVTEKNVLDVSVVDDELVYVVLEPGQAIDPNMSRQEVMASFDMEVVHGNESYPVEDGMPYMYTAAGGEPVYAVFDGSEAYVVRGDERDTSYDDVRELGVVDGRVVYIGALENSERAVVDGRAGEPHDAVRSLTAVDGELAYVAGDGRTERVVVGGEEREGFRTVNRLQAVGGEPAYAATLRYGGEVMVHGGERYGVYDTVGMPTMVDGELAFAAYDDGEAMVVYGNESVVSLDDVSAVGSFDGELAYVGMNESEVVYSWMGRDEPMRFDELRDVWMGELPVLVVRGGDGTRVVAGDDVSPVYSLVGGLGLSSDGVVFAARQDGKSSVVDYRFG